MNEPEKIEVEDENKLIAERRGKLNELRENGNAFPNDFRRNVVAGELHAKFDALDKAAIDEAEPVRVKVAGRMMLKRVMGKASFATLQDMSGRIQIYVQGKMLPEGGYDEFKKWDIGDIIGVEGVMFRTQKGELSIKADEIRLLTKSLRPLPDKFHGLEDQETRYRQRYVDLIMNDPTRKTFLIRSQCVSFIRRFLEKRASLKSKPP